MTSHLPRRRPVAALLFLCLAPFLVSGCATGAATGAASGSASGGAAPAGCSPLFKTAMVTEVYFGLSRPDGSDIPENDWREFLKTAVAAAFPDGFTVIRAKGYWRGEGMTQMAQEKSLILKVIHPAGPEAAGKLAGIAKRYAKRFEQQAVLLSTTGTNSVICN